ncbi:hypothetical protein Psuf_044300 [Phytohabitans suffuscus]|uniref:Uncharacterized protein n=1 Tax=Phytohabitans suffuscus TaxID=624315 RepID=A0A6F8YM16_9ACTN|nr:hypothetical protein [Phytohabitans suffuscus]BCB87117.1 hypothetical protein Psuf_044300 [Phytohabitans suffuscus]
MTLGSGRVLADTASTSGAFAALALRIGSDTSQIVNDGPAWYSVTSGDAAVSEGKVDIDGTRQPVTNRPLTCGDGVVVRPPAGTPSDSPSPSESLIPEETPSPTPSPTASPTEGDDPADPGNPGDPGTDPTTPGVPPTTPGVPPTTPGVPPTTPGTTPPSEPPTDPPTSEPTNSPPVITTVVASPQEVGRDSCRVTVPISVTVRASDSDGDPLEVTGSWAVDGESGTFGLKGRAATQAASRCRPGLLRTVERFPLRSERVTASGATRGRIRSSSGRVK